MKLIDYPTISNLGIKPLDCCAWVEEALAIKRSSQLPAKISLKPHEMDNVFYNTMPCIIPSVKRAGLKLVTRYPHRKPALDSQILLYDLTSGECLALMDGNWITTMRTGAVAAHSAMRLQKKDAKRYGFIGLGNTARATMSCLAPQLPEDAEIGVLAYKDQADSFVSRFVSNDNLNFRIFNDVEQLCSWSDVLFSSVTAAEQDFCPPEVFAPGCTVVPIHTRGFGQCDLAFDRIFCDDEAHVSGFKYYNRFKSRLTELSAVVEGRALGRESDNQRLLVYNIGISLHDIYFASKAFELVKDRSPRISLEPPCEKFWV